MSLVLASTALPTQLQRCQGWGVSATQGMKRFEGMFSKPVSFGPVGHRGSYRRAADRAHTADTNVEINEDIRDIHAGRRPMK